MICYNCMRDKGDAAVCPYCRTQHTPVTQPHHICPGTVIGNRYLLGRVLGEGGFGITYIGREITLGITVAVKEYYPYGFCSRNTTVSNTVSIISEDKRTFYEKGRSRFLREARTLAKFQETPGVVNVRDFIEENNTAYIVMEYLDGITLREFLRNNGPVGAEQAVQMLLPVMRALEGIHRSGVIHRDISPDNIMMLRDGSLKLMDFGAARDYDGDNRSMSIMLKQGYAPEEQYRRNGEQGPWTDVYGICATIYRCITGTTPVDAIDRLHSDTLSRPSALGVAISPALENTLMYGLALHKENRCPDMAALIYLTEQALRDGNAPFPAGSGYRMKNGVQDPHQTVIADTDPFPQQQLSRTPPLSGYPPQQQETKRSAGKSYAALVIAAICLVVVALAAGIAAIVLVNRDVIDDAKTSSRSSSAASAENDVAADADVTMPDLVGLTKESAISRLNALHLSSVTCLETESDEQPPGSVLDQSPKEGAAVSDDTRIILYIATRKPTEKQAEPATEKAQSQPETKPVETQVSTPSYLYCTAATYVALHQSDSATSKTLRKIWNGQSVKYISASAGWYYVESGGVKGYAASRYLSANAGDVPNGSGQKLYSNANIDDFLSLRQSASENAAELVRIPADTAMTFLGSVVDNGGVRSDGYHVQWAYVSYNGYTGYVYDFYIHD